MPDSRIFAPDEETTVALAGRIAARAQAGDAILLSGPLGAGKTAFARGFIRAAMGDAVLEVPSPTFTLVQSYDAPAATIWHYDLWRLPGPAGLNELGWDEARDGIVLVEWPERLGALTPTEALQVTISLHPQFHKSVGREIVLRGQARWLDAP